MGRLVKIDDSKRGAAVYQSTVTAPRATASTAPTATPRTVSGTEAAKSLQASIDAVRKSGNRSFERSGKTRDAYDSSVRSGYRQRQQGLLEQATADYRATNNELQGNTLKMLGIYGIGKALDKDISQSETLAGLVQRQDELQRQKTAMLAENPELKDPGALERIGKTVSGAIKQWGASNANSAATQYAAGSERRNTETDERLKEAQEGLARYQKLYQEALAEGDPNGDAGNYKNMIDHYQRQVDAFQQVPEAQQGAARESMQLADTLAASGAGDIQRAKQGAGKFGQTMVDVGAAGTQMAADMLAGKALGTKTSVPMMFRSFGGAAQEARQDGATIGEQMAYGAASAAVSGLTEQLSNVSKLFKGAFGKGVADDLVDTAIDKAVKRFAATEGGKAILRGGLKLGASAAGEGFEEMVEDIVNPMVKLIYQAKGQDPYGILSRTYAENFDLEETLYDGLIGAAMGLIGGTPEAIGNTVQGIRGNTETTGGYNPDAPANIGQIIDDVRAKGAQTNPAMERVLDSVNEVVNGQKNSDADSGVIVYSGNSALDRPTGLAYTLASNRDQISDMSPVKALTGTEMNAKSKKPSEQIREFFAKIGNKVFRPSFGEVSLNEYGVGGMLNHRPLNRAKMVTLTAVPEVIENGRIIAETENWKNRGYKSIVFAAPVTINGKTVYVAAVVDQRPDNKFYLSECVDSEGNFVRIKESPTGDAKSGVTAQGGFTTTPDGGSLETINTSHPQEGKISGYKPSAPSEGTQPFKSESPQTATSIRDSVPSRDSVPQSQAQYNPNFNQNQGGNTGNATSVGAADAGYDAFSQMQNQTDKFHPINEHAAQATQERFGRFPVETPLKNSQGQKISKTVSTFLNSPNTDNDTARLIEDQIAKNGLSYIPLTDDTVFRKATNSIKNKGYATALSDFYKGAENRIASKENNALGIALYNEAVAAGDSVTAFNILDTLQDSVRDSARALQVMNAINKLTPAGKLYMIDGVVRKMNESSTAKGKKGASDKAVREIGKEITGTIMAADATINSITNTFDNSKSNGFPANEWWMESATSLTDSVDRMVKANPTRKKTTMETILSDLKRFAATTARQEMKKRGMSRTELDAVLDYISNKEFYDDVWLDAQQLLQEKYADDPESLAMYQDWLNDNITDAISNTLGKKAGKGHLDKLAEVLSTGGFTDEGLRSALNHYIFGTDPYTIDPTLANEFLNAETDEARNDALDRIKQNIADQIPSTFMDKFTALRYLNMLGNLKTQIKNVGGNAVMQAIRVMKNTIATSLEVAMDSANRAFGGNGIERTKSFKRDKGLFKAAWDDAKTIESTLLGAGKYSARSELKSDINDKRTIFKNNGEWGTKPDSNAIAKGVRKLTDVGWRVIEARRKATGWAMDKGDLVFSYFTYADSLAGYLAANGVTADQFQSGDVDSALLDRARAYAITESQKATFRDNNAFSDAISSIGFRKSDTLPKKVINMAVEGTVPFKKTPANVVARAAEYSPIGLVNTAIKSAKKIAGNSDISGADIIDSLSSSLTGTGLLVLGIGLFNAGLLRGGDDDDEAQQWFDELQGHQSYSLEVNGKSYTLDWVAPASIPLFTGADLAKYASENGFSLDDAYKLATKMTGALINMSMMQGVNDALSSVSYADDSLIAFTLNALLNYASQGFTSTLGGQIERTTEGNRMTTFTDAESSAGRSTQRYIGKTTAKMPGVDYNQTEYIDAWGRKQSNGTYLERIFQNFLSPGYSSEITDDPLDDLIQRVYDETGNSAVLPDVFTDRTVTIDGQEHTLTQDEKKQWQITYGTTRHDILQQAYDMGIFETMSTAEREAFMVDARGLAREMAKTELSKSLQQDYDGGSYKKAIDLIDSGVPASDYLTFNSIFKISQDKNEAAGVNVPNGVEAIEAIERAGIDDAEIAGKLWAAKNSSTKEEKNPYTGTLSQYGVTPDEMVDIMTKWNEIDKLNDTNKDIKAGDQAAEMSKWLDTQKYSDTQREQIEAMYGFYTGYQASPTPYNRATMTKSQGKMYDTWGKDHGYKDVEKFLKYYNVVKETRASDEYKGYASQSRKDSLVKDKLVEAGMKNRTEAGNFLDNYQ